MIKIEIFRLFGTIFLKDDDVDNKLDKVDKKAGGVGQTLTKMGGFALKAGAVIGTAAVAAAGGMFTLAEKTAETGAAIDDMAVRTGLSRKYLQELKFASDQTGVSFDAITPATAKLTKFMDAAANGNKGASEAFKELGIKVTDSKGGLESVSNVMPQVLEKLSGMKNETERNALAMQIFGKGAVELVPLMSQGAGGLKALTDQAHKLGVVMSDEAIAASAKFDDSWAATKMTLQGVVAQIGVSFMPMFQGMLDWIMNHMPQIRSIFETVFGVIGSVVRILGDIVKNTVLPALVSLWQWIQPYMPQIKQAFEKTFNTLKDVLGKAGEAIKQTTAFFKEHWNIVGPILIGIVAGLAAFKIINQVIAWVNAAKIAFAALNLVMSLNPIALVAIAIGVLVTAGVLLYKNWDTVKAKAKQLWEAIGAAWEKGKTAIAGFFNDMVKAGKNIVEGIWQGISGAAGWLYNKIKEFTKNYISDPIKNFLGIHSPSTLMAEYGKYVAEGFGKGMDDNKKIVVDASEKLAEAVKEKTAKTKQQLLSDWEEIKTKIQAKAQLMATAITDALDKIENKLGITAQINQAKFDLMAAKFGAAASESQKLKWKIEDLNTQMADQNKVVSVTEAAYNRMVKATGANSTESQNLYLKLLQEKTALANLQGELQSTTKEYNDMAAAAVSARNSAISSAGSGEHSSHSGGIYAGGLDYDTSGLTTEEIEAGVGSGDWIGSFAVGGYIPKTGKAQLHAGEYVLTKNEVSAIKDTVTPGKEKQTVQTISFAEMFKGAIFQIRDQVDAEILARKFQSMTNQSLKAAGVRV